MNSNIPMEKKEEDFNQILQVANEDWSLLEDLTEKRFVLKKKKDRVNIDNIANELMEISTQEDNLDEVVKADEGVFKSAFIKPTPEEISPLVYKAEKSENQKIIKHDIQISQLPPEVEEIPSFMNPKKSSNTIFKMLAVGLTKLYVNKTTVVLNPVKFVVENSKKLGTALIHMGVPLLMSWYLITQVNFIHLQLEKEIPLMFWTYCGIFYFASLFVWVTAQVLMAGLYSMFKNAALDIAKAGENKLD